MGKKKNTKKKNKMIKINVMRTFRLRDREPELMFGLRKLHQN